MDTAVFVDTCILGKLSNPNDTGDNKACKEWAIDLRRKGKQVRIPEIADYELRRALILADKRVGIDELDRLIEIYDLVSLSTDAMRLAAQLWAEIRTTLGKAGTDDKRLDGDVILCAQAKIFAQAEATQVEIATDNVRHFQPFVDGTQIVAAGPWQDIKP